MSDEEAVAERVHELLQKALSARELPGCHEGGLVTSWVLVGEYIGSDGEPGWYLLVDNDGTVSRSMGLVSFAEQVLATHVRTRVLGTGGSDR